MALLVHQLPRERCHQQLACWPACFPLRWGGCKLVTAALQLQKNSQTPVSQQSSTRMEGRWEL
eukprot:5082335-Amphidinium_carterae.1